MLNFSANVSSLIAHQDFANVNANNIANVNTDGFIPTRTTLSDSTGSVSANFQSAADNGSSLSQTDLSRELTDQIVVQNGHEVQGTAIRTRDEMLGSLLDILA
jgi:flagellar hook protein FlgE